MGEQGLKGSTFRLRFRRLARVSCSVSKINVVAACRKRASSLWLDVSPAVRTNSCGRAPSVSSTRIAHCTNIIVSVHEHRCGRLSFEKGVSLERAPTDRSVAVISREE